MKLVVLLFTIIVSTASLMHCSSSMQAASAQSYDGLYRLTKIVDTTIGEVPIPNDGIYTIQMRPATSSDIFNQYNIGIKVGNSMGGSATITPTSNYDNKDEVSIGGLRSTMMMPPPELYRIEVALSDLLPSATTIKLEDDVLTIKGSKGSVQAIRQV